jgi:hypothetical protein
MRIEALSGWTSEQRHVVAACFLGWTLDAFDFFLLVFVLTRIQQPDYRGHVRHLADMAMRPYWLKFIHAT